MNKIKNLPKNAKQIKNALTWVDPKGNVYGCNKHYYFKYATFVNRHNGYVYCAVKYILGYKDGQYITENRQRRVHILVAETFLDNPKNYPIVGHKNNIKSDNRVENLYWTTYKENTQKAYDDGLAKNDKGYDDSQSHPVIMFDTYTNKVIDKFGSAREASRVTNICLGTIMRQAKYKRPVRKPYYFRFEDDESVVEPTNIVQYDFKTDEEINRFFNIGEASRKTGINGTTISDQCNKGKKPKWSKYNCYFLRK